MKSIIVLLASLFLLACASNAENLKQQQQQQQQQDAPIAPKHAPPVDEEEIADEANINNVDELESLAKANAFINAYLRQLIRQRQMMEQQQEAQQLIDDDLSGNDELNGDDEASSNGIVEKRSSARSMALSKKESPIEQQRNKEMRRQQAARWDIGFGKRAYKPKSFMDALYGKRSNLYNKQLHPKFAYGRKQQWDIQYGRK